MKANNLLKQNTVLSCYWNVTIKGIELDQTRRECVESVTFDERCDGSDTLVIKIKDPNFVFINDNIFVKEVPITAEVGFNEDTYRHTFSGYISAIDIDFPPEGSPVMMIHCMDNTYLMHKKKKKRTWSNTNSASVVQLIAQEYGFDCVIEENYSYKTEKTITQSQNTDIEFCEGLASREREPFICKLMGNTLYYIKKGLLNDPTATLVYKDIPYDIVSFSPQINKATLPEETASADINTSDKSVDSATADSSNTDRDVQGKPVDPTPEELFYAEVDESTGAVVYKKR